MASPSSTNNRTIIHGSFEGYVFTGERRIPAGGELYARLVQGKPHIGEGVLRSGGMVGVEVAIMVRANGQTVVETDLTQYVVVRVEGVSGKYTYEVPAAAELFVGDKVIVPFGSGDGERVGTVRELGRGDWDGYTKPVRALLSEEVYFDA